MSENLKVKKRVEAAGQRLAEWLNSPYSHGHPITRLIAWTQALMHGLQHHRLERPDVEDFKDEINAIVRKYPAVFELEAMDVTRPGVLYFRFRSLGKTRRQIDGLGVVNDVRIVSEGGLLARVRRCKFSPCKHAFYARKSDNIFHCEACKEGHKRSSAQFKKKKRDDAAKEYRKGLLPEQRKRLDEKRAKRAKRLAEKPAPNWSQFLDPNEKGSKR